jgi:hypothetical protein
MIRKVTIVCLAALSVATAAVWVALLLAKPSIYTFQADGRTYTLTGKPYFRKVLKIGPQDSCGRHAKTILLHARHGRAALEYLSHVPVPKAVHEILWKYGGFQFLLVCSGDPDPMCLSSTYGEGLEGSELDPGSTANEIELPAETKLCHTKVEIPFWALFTLFAWYPGLAFICGPFRRWRRHGRALCTNCGYNLTGNVSGVCPECGTAMRSRSR